MVGQVVRQPGSQHTNLTGEYWEFKFASQCIAAELLVAWVYLPDWQLILLQATHPCCRTLSYGYNCMSFWVAASQKVSLKVIAMHAVRRAYP